MPRRAAPSENAEDRAIRQLDEEMESYLQRAALEAGPPADSKRLSERDEDDIWAIEDPSVQDVESLAQRLAVQGLTPEEAQQLQIISIQTDQERQAQWMAALTQPTQDLQRASELVKAARYPWRGSLLEDIDDPDEQVQKANTLDRRYQKRMTGEQQYEVDAAQPAPQMPEMGG